MKKKGYVRVSQHGAVIVIDDAMLHQVESLAILGANNEELAMFFEVGLSTIESWLRKYPEVQEARKRGGMIADMKVAKSLYKRATGYSDYEERVFRIGRKLVKKKVKVNIAPDVKAAVFWLSSRQRRQWTQTQRVAHTGTITHKHTKVEDLPIHELDSKTQDFLFEIAQKQLTSGERDN